MDAALHAQLADARERVEGLSARPGPLFSIVIAKRHRDALIERALLAGVSAGEVAAASGAPQRLVESLLGEV